MDRSFNGVGPESRVTGRSNQLNYVPGNLNQEQTAVSVRIGNGKSACVYHSIAHEMGVSRYLSGETSQKRTSGPRHFAAFGCLICKRKKAEYGAGGLCYTCLARTITRMRTCFRKLDIGRQDDAAFRDSLCLRYNAAQRLFNGVTNEGGGLLFQEKTSPSRAGSRIGSPLRAYTRDRTLVPPAALLELSKATGAGFSMGGDEEQRLSE